MNALHDSATHLSNELVSETLQFLRGTKTSEYMSDALRAALYVPRKLTDGQHLEPLLAEVLAHGRSVLVAGSAGGGKTMLLSSVTSRLHDIDVRTRELSVRRSPNAEDRRTVVVVPDLTAVVGDRGRKLATAMEQGPLLVAANEGVLRATKLPGDLANSTETLRKLQSGDLPSDPEEAVVVDLAGLDPVMGALPFLLRHRLLHAAVRSEADDCDDAETCPRRLALEQLLAPEMAEMLAGLVHAAVGPGELLFRDVWDFISDLLLGGQCKGGVPTSPWFWRCFFGDSVVATELHEALAPEFLSLPRLSPYLYRGDWARIDESLGTDPAFVLPGRAPVNVSDGRERAALMHWLRIQSVLLTRRLTGRHAGRFIGELASSLEDKVSRHGEVRPLVQGLNAYFQRKKATDTQGAVMDLWVEMSVERATSRAASLVSLGQLSSTRLGVIRSRVVGNLPGVDQEGSRLYLAGQGFRDEKPLLVLDFKLFRALAHGRPVATSDRSGDDADFAIRRFMFQAASQMELEDKERIALISWDRSSTATESSWRLLPEDGRIESLR